MIRIELNGSFAIIELPFRFKIPMSAAGQLLTFAIPLARSFKGPVDSETCQTVYGSTSA